MTSPIPPAILAQHVAILGKTGSGKTSTAKLCIEQVVAQGARVCVLDPIKSDWWGLTSSANGKNPGLPFQILGGPRGHVPLDPAAGGAVGELVATGKLPLSIIDMADFPMGGLARFFVDFAPALFRHVRGVVYVVMEEAHEFGPKERAGFGNENMLVHWCKKLANARSKGVRLIAATQRVQSLHNAVLGSCDTIIAHRLTFAADQAPVLKVIEGMAGKSAAAAVACDLGKLPTGEAWVCSGEAEIFQKMRFPRITTYDNSATPTGDPGTSSVRTAPVDLAALRNLLGAAVDEAKANDPKELRAKIADLTAKLAKAQNGARAPDVNPDGAAIARAAAERDKHWRGELAKVSRYSEGLAVRLHKIAAIAHLNGEAKVPAVVPPATVVSAARASPALRPRLTPSGGSGAAMPSGERAILTALAQNPDGCERDQIGILTGYKRSTRDAYILRLESKGFVDASRTPIVATQQGVDALGDFEPLPTGDALLQHWLGNLPEGEAKILRLLADAWPNPVARDGLSEYKRSTRDAYLLRLSARRLVSSTRDGVKASDLLFDGAIV